MGNILDLIAPGKKSRANPLASTQSHLRIGEIRDNTLILKNGGLRSVLRTSSINFNLKSEQEQEAIVYAYQGFLNSLEFPIQIIIRSKKLDIDDYIDQVKGLGEKQKNPLLQEQTYEYAEYIKKLVEFTDIMEKEFYVVVPYNPIRSTGTNQLQSFFQNLSPKDSYVEIDRRHKEFDELRKSLSQRINVVSSGLEGCGLQVEELTTQELIELFYNSYNPNTSRTAKLKDLDKSSIKKEEEHIENNEEKE